MHNHKSPSIEGLFFARLGLLIALAVLFFE